MTKRRRSNNDNPLSQARGSQKQPTDVWFRRSGGGFQLFVEYYSRQPAGTVSAPLPARAHGIDDDKSKKPSGIGLSRASKRRRKKKQKLNISDEAVDDFEPDKAPAYSDIRPATTASSSVNRTLLDLLGQPNLPAQMLQLKPFLQAMTRPLPVTFRLRLSLSKDAQESIRQQISSEFHQFVQPVSWNRDVYQTRMNLSKIESATVCPKFKQWLLEHSQDGTLARQETGSMLPVIALQHAGFLRKGSRVLDMCASPGSKTLQGLEVVGSSGRVIANDISESRLNSLQQAVARSGVSTSLTKLVSYTCSDARKLICRNIQPDVVICDVPCSGDGTARKDKCILPMWQPRQGNQLHAVQLGILEQALALVKPGGVVCYSTCSLNPVENEAVVSAALRKLRGDRDSPKPKVELVKWSSPLGFVRRPGICNWRVADYTGFDDEDDERVRLQWYDTWQDAVDAGMDQPLRSMWSHTVNDQLRLEHCIRLWPQDQDSGGFFLALMRKNG